MLRSSFVLALVLATSVLAACDSDEPTTPTEPSPTAITETFTGTLTLNGAVPHTFIVQRAGEVSARIAALAPSDAVVSLSIGPLSSQGCSQSLARDNATSGTVIVGTASVGNFCVRISDPNGTLTGPVDYELSVTHF